MTIINDLERIGLNKYEAKAYHALLVGGQQTGREIARLSGVPQTRVFDVLKNLQDKGFVQLVGQRPMLWLAKKPEVALKGFVERKVADYTSLETQLINALKGVKAEPIQNMFETVTLASGFEEVFSIITSAIKDSTKAVYISSVGEPIPTKTSVEIARAIKRGVQLRFIATRYTALNKDLLHERVEEGWVSRHLLGSDEYSVIIIDNSKAILMIKNPKRKNERILILLNNKDLSKALSDYYQILWKKAKPIA
jgi:HTH-type transcriptional regulator, sugar sensing transcriptional regulator